MKILFPRLDSKRGYIHALNRVGRLVVIRSVRLGLDMDSEGHGPSYYVDPRIGADHTSNNSIGPQMPWGSMIPQPDMEAGNFAGYGENKPIRGFSQLRITGGGAGGYGNIPVSPQIGLETDQKSHDSSYSEESPDCSSYTWAARLYPLH